MPGMRTDPNKSPEDFWLSRKLREYTSLDTPADETLGDSATQLAGGFIPGVGQAMALRDMERARRDNDYTGMALSGVSLIPGAHLIKALRKGGGAVQEVIAGRRAANAPHRALDAGEEIANRGATPQQQWDQTRTYRGPDKQMKWEIDDTPSKLRVDPSTLPADHEMALKDLLHHPELYQNYPSLADTRVKVNTSNVGEGSAFYHHPKNMIGMGPDARPGQLQQSLLHEVQHGVQAREPGFSRGASDDHIRNALVDKLMDKQGRFPTPEEGKRLTTEAERMYLNNMGEAESRAVENRWVNALRKQVPSDSYWGHQPDQLWHDAKPPY